jgi:hypothetical protein
MERIEVPSQPGENSSKDPISKITRAKWTGSVVQALKCLLCKWVLEHEYRRPSFKVRTQEE